MKQELQARAEGTGRSSSIIYGTTPGKNAMTFLLTTTSGSSGRPIRQPAAADDPFSIVIPETVLPERWDAPLQNPIPRMVPPPPAPIQRRGNRLNQSAVAQAAMVIPETVLPEGWDAPLQNPLPRLVPFLPAPALRRVRPDAHREVMADHQIQQQHALAVLQEQQRLRHIAIVEEQERQQQALAILHQARLREEERLRQQEQEHIDLDPEHRPLNAAMAQRIFQGWQQQHEADLEEDFNDLGPQNDIPSEDDLEYVDPAGHQPAEQMDPPLDVPLAPQDDIPSDDDLEYVDPAEHQPAEQMDPLLDMPLGPQDDIPSDDDLEYVDPV
ncbi:hypothetical protein E4T56_gene15223 [Termitomyces sp. T112]|nr:hypothetical protein E4T56_gene15223 [Termitomyces sp. T112]